MTAFITNGLLGDKAQDISPEMSFSLNGLLESSKSSFDQTMKPGRLGTWLEAEPVPDTPQFSTNGLLSRGGDDPAVRSDASVPPDILPNSQDEELPPVSEAFGIRLGLTSDHARSLALLSTSNTSRYSVRATTFDGRSVQIKRKPKISQEVRNRISPGSASTVQRMGSLLDVPIHKIMDELSAATAASLRQAEQQPQSPSNSGDFVEDTLWVDRYRPRRFMELMGNERVARETMEWVKQWDWCVFGNTRGKKRPRNGDENYNENDEYHRPREKLLLLSGPPGLGKTTLAHVVARQAGYEVMEINASDARSGSIVDDWIRPALESGAAVGSTKPVLLIIDEIDGATGAGENSTTFIHKLVQLTQDRPRRNHQSGQKRDSHTKRAILRPIVCICNDPNASSLAKLKPYAHHIRLSRPADIHTVKRLREVCELEGLKVDSRALSTLVGIAKGDLRGCLNTLQFIKSQNEEVTETIIRSATTGMNHADTSLSSVLNNLFNPLTRKRVKELAMSEEEEGKYVARLGREVDGSGRENSIASGCFAHYATLRQHDANFSRYEKANEWLVTFDILSTKMYLDGSFALSQYLPYTLVPFYPLFQERGGQRVERNQADWENLQLTRSNEEIYKSLSRCLRSASMRYSGNFRHLLSTPVLQLEFTPYINRIISPPLRPVNSQVIRPDERALLTRLVSIMASLELRFCQERAEDGQSTYRLEPPIDVFVTYDGKRAIDIAVSRYAVRHLVAGEIDALLLARDADIIEKGKRGKHNFFGGSLSKKSEAIEGPDMSDEAPAHLQSLDLSGPPTKRAKVDKIDIADKPPTDFFGRIITVPTSSSTKAAARKNIEKKYRVTYKYAEGNSAAVRKPVKVCAFL